MAKRRRRQKQQYQPRPVNNRTPAAPRAPEAPTPEEQERPQPLVSPAGIPNTGMPISVPGIGALPNDDPRPEEMGYVGGGPIEQTGHWGPKEVSSSSSFDVGDEEGDWSSQGIPGIPGGMTGTGQQRKRSMGGSSNQSVQNWARGGAIPDPMPGYANYIAMKTDPVARRRYSPRHVGFAGGGEVGGGGGGGYVDAMDYMPDPMREPRAPQRSFDEFNMIGRESPQANPMLTADEPTGYAKGGPIAAAQVPAYTTPVTPPPSAANAKLYADVAALRERTANPPPLQMPALPSLGGGGYSGPPPQFQTAGEFSAGVAPHTTPGINTPLPGVAIGGGGGGGDNWDQSATDAARWFQLNSLRDRRFAEGGEVPENGAAAQGGAAPDAVGYLNGDNAMDPQELDGVLQQIAQLDPNQSEDAVNLTAIVQAAQSGDMERASSILAGFRQRFDRLNAHAQGAAAHNDLQAAAQLAGKAHSQVPDGMTVSYAVTPEGSVTATVSPSNASFTMSAQQFHDYLVGPATDFDHILENGLEKNLTIASGGQKSGQQAPGANPAPTGYAEGGEVEQDDDDSSKAARERGRKLLEQGESGPPTTSGEVGDARVRERGREVARFDAAHNTFQGMPHPSYSQLNSEGSWANPQYGEGGVRKYQEGGEVDYVYGGGDVSGDYTSDNYGGMDAQQQQEERRRQEVAAQQQQAEQTRQQQPQQRDDGSRQSVKDVLDHTRAQYGMGDGPSRGDIASETAGLGLGQDRVAPLTGEETQLAASFGGGSIVPADNSTAGAGGVYYPPGYGPGGGGGGGGGRRHRPSGGGGQRRSSGGGGRSNGSGGGGDETQSAAPEQEVPQRYTTGYQQPIEYTPQPPGTDLRRTDTEGRPIGPAMDQPVPEAASRGEPVRTDTQGRPIGGMDTRPDPNDPRAYAKREFPNDPAGQNAVLANQYLKGSQREYDALQRAGENRSLTPDSAERLAELERGRQEAAYDWDAFAKDKGLKPASQIIQDTQQARPQRGGGGRADPNRSDPNYGRTVLDDDGWPTGVPRGGTFANTPGTATRDYSQAVTFGRKGGVGRAGATPVYDVRTPGGSNVTYRVDPETGLPRPRHFQPGFQEPLRGQPNWTGTYPANQPAPAAPTYQTRPVAPRSEGPTAAPTGAVGAADVENAPPYQVAGKDWIPPPAQPAAPSAPAGGGAPAPDNRGGPPGAVYQPPQEWQPAPNIRGSASVPPPTSDQSPAAQAARQFPSADNQAHRSAYQIQLERQSKEDALKREGYTSKETVQDAKNQAAFDRIRYQRESIEKVAGGKQAIMEQHYKMIHDDNVQAQIIRHLDANSRMQLQKYGDEIKAGVLTAETPAIRTLMEQIQKRALQLDLPIPELRPPTATTGTETTPTTGTMPTVRTAPTNGTEGGTLGPKGENKPGYVWTNNFGGGWIKQ